MQMFCQLRCNSIMNHTVLTGLVRLSLYLLVQERIQSYTKSQSSQVEQLKHSSHLRLNLKSQGPPAMRIQFWNLHLISSHPYLQIQVICSLLMNAGGQVQCQWRSVGAIGGSISSA